MRARAVTALLLAATLGSPALAEDAVPAPGSSTRAPRPKVVLVLSGGGARGAAHLGVLKVLEELHVPVDMVVGTSAGALVGGLYASGWTPEEIESGITTIDWASVFVDRLDRRLKSYRRKQDDRVLVPLKMRFKNWKPYVPPSVIGGQSLELKLQRFEIDATGARDFDAFPIPYRAVATDLSTGQVVVLDHGSLAAAMRASMSIPGVFPPVELDGRPLCDGELAANFPIRVARSLGADTIIGVDISSPLHGKHDLGNFLKRLDQVTNLLTLGNLKEDMAAAQPQDILMAPELGDINFAEFQRFPEAIASGEAAARAVADRLRALSVSDEDWAAFLARHHRRPPSDRVVDAVVVKNSSYLGDGVVERRIAVPIGKPLDEGALDKQLLGLYSLDTLGTIHHDLTRLPDGSNVLTVDVPRKPYGRNSLQFGLNLETDFHGDITFNVAVGHLVNPLNRLGGEWRNIVQFGDDRVIGTELFQPLDEGMRWFFDPVATARIDKYRLYDAEGAALAEYGFDTRDVRAGIGRVFGVWGQAQVGIYRSFLKADKRVGTSALPSNSYDDGGVFASFRVDTLDDFAWPTDGIRADVSLERGIGAFGADADGSIVKASFGGARSIGKNVLFGSVEAANSTQDLVSPTVLALGGLFRLSGLKNDELIGSKGGLIRLMYYRELSSFSLGGVKPRVFVGMSLEAGNAYRKGDPVDWGGLRESASVFAGASTILGPAYLGVGYSDGGRTAVYLVLGQRF